LQKCLAVYHKEKEHEKFRATLADIRKVRTELEKLEEAKEAAKEQANNDNKERSGKAVL
jgi:uncharacterized coiled-coil DUF342 family protein